MVIAFLSFEWYAAIGIYTRDFDSSRGLAAGLPGPGALPYPQCVGNEIPDSGETAGEKLWHTSEAVGEAVPFSPGFSPSGDTAGKLGRQEPALLDLPAPLKDTVVCRETIRKGVRFFSNY